MSGQKQLLKKYNITPNKRLGQNFLLSQKPVLQIIEAAKINKNDVVIEIGAGLGALTLILAKKAKQIIAVEKDKKITTVLSEILLKENIKNVKVVNEDALQVQNSKLKTQNHNLKLKSFQYKMIGNLPYNCATAIIMKFLQEKAPPQVIVAMLQKEVGQRITAKPPNMNKLAVFSQFFAEAKIIGYVKKTEFSPKPKADSAIIKLIPLSWVFSNKPPANIALFEKIVKAGFAMPRKTLANNLRRSALCNFDGEQTSITAWLEQNSINPSQRPQELSLRNWLNLAGPC